MNLGDISSGPADPFGLSLLIALIISSSEMMKFPNEFAGALGGKSGKLPLSIVKTLAYWLLNVSALSKSECITVCSSVFKLGMPQ